MVKQLGDICLQCIAQNLDSISNVGRRLPTSLKETLLKRLVDHDMLTTSYLPHITYHLFCPAIRWIEFRYSDQVTDEVLLQLSYSLCKLQRVTLEGCSNITGETLIVRSKVTVDSNNLSNTLL